MSSTTLRLITVNTTALEDGMSPKVLRFVFAILMRIITIMMPPTMIISLVFLDISLFPPLSA
jgi:hypothetical protein